MRFAKLLQQSIIWRGFYFTAVLTLNIILSRYLKASGTGWVYFLTNLFSFTSLLGSLNLESGFSYFGANKSISLSSLGWFGLLFTLGVTWLVIPLIQTYFHFYPIEGLPTAEAVQYGILYTGGIVIANLFSVLFYAQNDFTTPNICLGIINYIIVLSVVLMNRWKWPTHTVVGTYFLFFAIQGIVLALVFLVKNKSYQSFTLPNWAQIQQLFRYSLVALTANFIFFFVYRVDFWFMQQYRPAAELGNYIQASKLGQMLLILPQIIASVVLPHTAEGTNNQAVAANLLVLSRLLIQFFILAMVGAYLLGNWVFIHLFGTSFDSMYLPFFLLLPGILSLAILTLLSAYFAGINKTRVNVNGAAIALLVVIPLNVLFTQQYGMVAAAIISSIGYFINLAYSYAIFIRITPERTWLDILEFKAADYYWIKRLYHKK